MIGQLEKSKERNRENAIEDYPYYITIAFRGAEEEIQRLAIVFFNEFLRNRYCDIYDAFIGNNTYSGIIGKTADKDRYTIDTTQLFDVLESKSNEYKACIHTNSIRLNALFSAKKTIWLSADDAKKNKVNRFERKERINKIFNNLDNFTGINSNYMFLIAYKFFMDEDTFENRIDYEYFP